MAHDLLFFAIRDVKIFDLGLAKEIPSDVPGPWHLTTVVGSPRYSKFRCMPP